MAFFNINTALGVDTSPHQFILQGAGITALKTLLFRPDPQQIDTSTKKSLLGTPVFSSLEFKSGQYRDLDGQLQTFEGLRIDTVLFTVSQSKNIITTPIVGRNGTIKEYIADGDFQISANGIIIGETTEGAPQSETGVGPTGSPILRKLDIGNKYPERDVDRLIKLMQVPEPLKIRSEYLDRFGSFEIVVEGYELPQSPGTSNVQLFNLRLLSDTPIELL